MTTTTAHLMIISENRKTREIVYRCECGAKIDRVPHDGAGNANRIYRAHLDAVGVPETASERYTFRDDRAR